MATIVVGLSGGVDSAVAAFLLKEQGHDVIGVFMKNWEETDEDGVCAAERDTNDARSVCEKIGIPFYTVNFVREYWERVFSYFLEEYRKNRTPNPDVLCNREIKFKAFLDFAMKIGADKLATGHFARLATGPDGRVRLLKGVDAEKDQSYFLHLLGQGALRKSVFPVGGMTKTEVRAKAREIGLTVSEKKDSTGICFIGERNFRQFLSQYLPAQAGEIRTETGEVVGKHVGLMYYTIGQRRGLGIGGRGDGRRWFVLSKDLERNALIVSQGEASEGLFAQALIASGPHWIAGAPDLPHACAAKIRYRQQDQACRVEVHDEGLFVRFEKPQRAIAPGQSVVFYDGDVCIGGAVIERAVAQSAQG